MSIPPGFIRERKFDSKLKLISKSYRRLDELDRAIEWALQHNPKQFYNICGEFYVWKTEGTFKEFPQLRILYRFSESENMIILIDAEMVEG